MPMPYENTTAGDKALGEIQKILRSLGCSKFGSMTDDAEAVIMVQFEYRGRQCSVKASIKGYAMAWMKANPVNIFQTDIDKGRAEGKRRAHKVKAMEIASRAVYSILRDWIKGQVMAIETGVLSFEGAFLGQMLLSNGRTVEEHVKATNLLPALEGPKP